MSTRFKERLESNGIGMVRLMPSLEESNGSRMAKYAVHTLFFAVPERGQKHVHERKQLRLRGLCEIIRRSQHSFSKTTLLVTLFTRELSMVETQHTYS